MDPIIGIDFSVNSTGVCIRTNHKLSFASLLNITSMTSAKNVDVKLYIKNHKYLGKLSEFICLYPFQKQPISAAKKTGVDAWTKHLLKDSIAVVNKMVDNLHDFVILADIEDPFDVIIEHYSYTKNTDNIIQMVEMTSAFKRGIYERLCVPIEKFHFIPGPNVKMLAGKGSYKKYDMLQAFLNNAHHDELLESNYFYKFLQDNESLFINKKKSDIDVLPPISDLVDSYFIALSLFQTSQKISRSTSDI